MSSFASQSVPINYLPFNQTCDNQNIVNCGERQLRDNNMPLFQASDASPQQWIMNPFCTSVPLLAASSGAQTTMSSDVASILATNLLMTKTCNPLNSINAALATIASIGNTSTNKEVIHFKNCSLYPPKHITPTVTTREKPLGCRTIFVGGLPENITEDILQEIFQSICGDIYAIRMSKKNFCHIRFESENCIDKAIALSGYRLKINELEDAPNTGRLHIDYAQARDDQYDWECKQRALQREMRHRERLEYDRVCPPSPPSVHFSDHESLNLTDKLKCEQSFHKAVDVLVTWLERGECQKRNSGQFYTMIQTTNNHVRRLQNERTSNDNEWLNARQLYRTRMQSILVQLSQIEKVFEAAVRQKAWDHFTKAQRKHIDAWFKQTKELKNAHIIEVVNKREEDEMDLSDGDDDDAKKIDISIESQSTSKMRRLDDFSDTIDANCATNDSSDMCLRDENDTLKCQVESFRNEAVFVQEESKQEKESLEKQIQILQQALQGMQHQLLTLSEQKRSDNMEIERFKSSLNNKIVLNEIDNNNCDQQSSDSSASDDVKNSKSALLISLISIYINVHPFGVTCNEISKYLKQQSSIEQNELLTPLYIEKFMSKYPHIFNQFDSDSDGSRLWRFCGFKS